MIDEDILFSEYNKIIPRYEDLGINLEQAFQTLLDNASLGVHLIDSRSKSFESFIYKIKRKGYKDPFQETEDICGVRIICFYQSDMEKISQLIHSEFDVIEYSKKADSFELDKFGYLSDHFILTIKKDWLKAPNYRDLGDLKAEVQVRTILMHAWANLSHELAYKKECLPDEDMRILYRLSALFEMADDEFDHLRNGLKGNKSAQQRYKNKSSARGLKGKETIKYLISSLVKPRSLANEFMVGLYQGKYNISDLTDLIYNLSREKTYDVCELIECLDISIIKAEFSKTNLSTYADLLAVVKHSRCGINYVDGLTPDFEIIFSRVCNGTGNDLRNVMEALFMNDRMRLWIELTDENLQGIINVSTLNQLNNLLIDAIKSKNKTSKQLGSNIATKLVNLDLSVLMKKSNLSEVSMFNNAVLTLNPKLEKEIFEQIFPYLENIIERESDETKIISKVSLILRDFQKLRGSSEISSFAYRLLQKMTQLDLLPYIQSSKEGLVHLIYWAIMIDKEISRKWFYKIDKHIWIDTILESSEDEAFWIIWNIWQVEQTLACSFVNEDSIRAKIATTPYGVSVLILCGISIENTCISPSQLTYNINESNLTKFILQLKVLCLHSNQDMANNVRSKIDLVKINEKIQDSLILHHTKELFLKILDEFEKITNYEQ
jgi:ppGpp synthetase/RelA/SpoT-type nucleotidyltranferase